MANPDGMRHRDVTVLDQLDNAQVAELHRLYDRVFDDQPDPAAWDAMWATHSARPGFQVALATDAAGQLVGFAYGYTGQRGQWWTDQALAALPPHVGRRWLGGHFELVTLGVAPEARRNGTGRELLRTVLSGFPHEKAVLMTDMDPADPARQLYAREGWEVLGPGITPGKVILGREMDCWTASASSGL